jgi:hypothetical protein
MRRRHSFSDHVRERPDLASACRRAVKASFRGVAKKGGQVRGNVLVESLLPRLLLENPGNQTWGYVCLGTRASDTDFVSCSV